MPKAEKTKLSQKEKPVHPLSRKAHVLTKNSAREKRLSQSHSSTAAKNDAIAQKVLWFQNEVDVNNKTFSKDDLVRYTMKYVKRFEDELDQISIIKTIGSRKGHPHVSRESAIKLSIAKDQQLLDSSGLEVPDIVNAVHLEQFRNWDGNLLSVQNIKFRKIFQRDFDKLNDENN